MIDLEAVVEVNPYHLISEVVQTSSNHVAEAIERHLPDPQRTLLDERSMYADIIIHLSRDKNLVAL